MGEGAGPDARRDHDPLGRERAAVGQRRRGRTLARDRRRLRPDEVDAVRAEPRPETVDDAAGVRHMTPLRREDCARHDRTQRRLHLPSLVARHFLGLDAERALERPFRGVAPEPRFGLVDAERALAEELAREARRGEHGHEVVVDAEIERGERRRDAPDLAGRRRAREAPEPRDEPRRMARPERQGPERIEEPTGYPPDHTGHRPGTTSVIPMPPAFPKEALSPSGSRSTTATARPYLRR